MYVQVQEWSQTHGTNLLYFWPATQEEEVLTDDLDDGEYESTLLNREKMTYCMQKV